MILLQLAGAPELPTGGKGKLVASGESVREGAGNFCCPLEVKWELCLCVCASVLFL